MLPETSIANPILRALPALAKSGLTSTLFALLPAAVVADCICICTRVRDAMNFCSSIRRRSASSAAAAASTARLCSSAAAAAAAASASDAAASAAAVAAAADLDARAAAGDALVVVRLLAERLRQALA
jgi:predicted lipid-binding transport protein (Tim44 family)